MTSEVQIPKRASKRDLDAELADAIESAWRSKFGEPTVVALAQLARIRRGDR